MILVQPKKNLASFVNGLQIFSNDDHFNVLFYMYGHHGLHENKRPLKQKLRGASGCGKAPP
jgi:hypothetical protein